MLEDQEHLPNFQDISVDQATMTTDDRWKTYFLYGYGFKLRGQLRALPGDGDAVLRGSRA